jgi:nicotinamide-nucleotide adenylyltransferase
MALNERGISPLNYWVIPVRDMHVHMMWVARLQGYAPKFQVVYSNDPLTRRLFFEAGFSVKSIPFEKRQIYTATEIRKRMLKNDSWKDLVPRSTADFIEEIDGVKRLQDLAKTDKV